MRRPSQNFVVDLLAFSFFLGLAGTGVLMHFQLPPGTHDVAIWGLGRHDWGAVHFWIAIGMLVSIVVHLLLHWRWIFHVVRGRRTAGRAAGIRLTLGALGLVGLVALASAPLVSPAGSSEPPAHRAPTSMTEPRSASAATQETAAVRADGAVIRGYMSLYQIERATRVPVAALVAELKLPPETSSDASIRSLAESNGFEVHEVRQIVDRRRSLSTETSGP